MVNRNSSPSHPNSKLTLDVMATKEPLIDAASTYDQRPFLRARNDYLWTSPDGLALPGVQHQLLLHLLGSDQSWRGSIPWRFDAIHSWLQQYWPQNVVSTKVLAAVAREYLVLPPKSKAVYLFEDLIPSAEAASLDPALFEPPSEQYLSDDFHFSDAAVPITFTPDEPRLREALTSSEGPSSDPAFEFSYLSNNSIDTTFDTTTLDEQVLESSVTDKTQESPVTPARSSIAINTPPRPHVSHIISTFTTEVERSKDGVLRSPLSPSNSRNLLLQKQSPTSLDTMASKIDPIAISDYPQAGELASFPQSQQATSKKSVNTHNKVSLSPQKRTSANKSPPGTGTNETTTSTKKDLPFPDTRKYINTSGRNWTIPTSEAEAFIAHFQPGFDPVPEKIEGHYWYCDDCYSIYTEQAASRGPPRGQYRSKRSVEKHYIDVHHKKWKPVLPEPSRSGRRYQGRRGKPEHAIMVATDQESQVSGTLNAQKASADLAELVDDMKENETPEPQVSSVEPQIQGSEGSQSTGEQGKDLKAAPDRPQSDANKLVEDAASEQSLAPTAQTDGSDTEEEPTIGNTGASTERKDELDPLHSTSDTSSNTTVQDLESSAETKCTGKKASSRLETSTCTTSIDQSQNIEPTTNGPPHPLATPLPNNDGVFRIDGDATQRKLFTKEIEKKQRSSPPSAVSSKSSDIEFDDLDTSTHKIKSHQAESEEEKHASGRKENVHVDFAPEQHVRFFNEESPPDRGEHKEEKDEQEEIYEPVKADEEPVPVEDKVTEEPLKGKKRHAAKRKAEAVAGPEEGGRRLRSRTKD